MDTEPHGRREVMESNYNRLTIKSDTHTNLHFLKTQQHQVGDYNLVYFFAHNMLWRLLVDLELRTLWSECHTESSGD